MLRLENKPKVLPMILLTACLSLIFVFVARTDTLEKYAYGTENSGWALGDGREYVSSRPKTEGFPFQSKRPLLSQDSQSGWPGEVNQFTVVLNVVLAVGVAALVSYAILTELKRVRR